MARLKQELRWTPVRHGVYYCSPACGCGCRYSAYVRVKARAAKLAKHLGPGWKPVVWENVGWHYRARLVLGANVLEVHQGEGKRAYWASLTGPDLHQIHGTWKTAKQAVAGVRDEALSRAQRYVSVAVGLEVSCRFAGWATRACVQPGEVRRLK